MTRRLIVNADDFGLTPGVSAGILAAHRHGIVTSTTVLVTADVDRASLVAARDSALGIGLHVNLTLGRPLTPARSLVDSSGRFIRDARRAAARASVTDVEREVAAQIEKFTTLVKTAVVLAAAKRLGVPVRSQNAGARARARSAGLRTPDHFFGESGPGAYWALGTTLVRLRELPPGVSEFMTHPGVFDDALGFSRYARQRETELVGLGTPAARAAAASLGIGLCHFGEV